MQSLNSNFSLYGIKHEWTRSDTGLILSSSTYLKSAMGWFYLAIYVHLQPVLIVIGNEAFMTKMVYSS